MALGDGGHPSGRGRWGALGRGRDGDHAAGRLSKLSERCRIAVAVGGFRRRYRRLFGEGNSGGLLGMRRDRGLMDMRRDKGLLGMRRDRGLV